MDFNRIHEAWTHQPDKFTSRTDDELIRLIVTRDRRLRHRATVRDYIELATAVCLAAGFVGIATLAPIRWPWIAAAAVTLAVAGVFIRERLRHRPPALHGAELHTSLQQALEEADHQIRLLGSVTWWYLLPHVGVVLLILVGTFLGARMELDPAVWARARVVLVLSIAIVLLVAGGTFWLVWWLNMRAVRRYLLPHRAAIAGLIRQLAGDDEEIHP